MFPAACDPEQYYAPVPAAGVFDSPGISLCLNTDWASFLDGALQPLLSPCRWAGNETEVDAAIQQVQRLLAALADVGDCTPPVGGSVYYAIIQDQKPSGSSGGTFSAGDWQRRDLNTVVSDAGGFVTLASNQVTLPAGTYRVRAICPAYYVNRHQARLQNVSDDTTVALGTSSLAYVSGYQFGYSEAVGCFTIAASKTFELQHRCQTSRTGNGFGEAVGFAYEIYSVLELWKEE